MYIYIYVYIYICIYIKEENSRLSHTSKTFALSTEQSFPCRFLAVSNATRAIRSTWFKIVFHISQSIMQNSEEAAGQDKKEVSTFNK
jgi:hypothetical protein